MFSLRATISILAGLTTFEKKTTTIYSICIEHQTQ
jgi:hypothetical protein